MRKSLLLTTALMLPLLGVSFSSPRALAQSGDVGQLQKEIESLKTGQAGIKSDLAEIKKLIAGLRSNNGAPAFKPTEISLVGAPMMGDKDAKVTLVEFTDLQCPFCSRHYKNTAPEIIKNFVDRGKVRYVVREFPLTNIHPRAAKASEASLCAAEQGKYWEMHSRIFDNQRALADTDLLAHAEALSLEKGSFESCLQSGKFAEQVKRDLAQGAKLGVRGTPSFVLGLSDPGDSTKFTATEFIRGARPYADFENAINKLLGADAKQGEAAGE